MKNFLKHFLYITVVFVVSISCTNPKWYDVKDSKGRSFLGEWHRLTDRDGQQVILNPPDAYNSKIVVDKVKKEVFVRYGQEDVTYYIEDVELKNDEFIFHLTDTEYIIKCEIMNDDQAKWSVPIDCEFIYTNKPKKYKEITEPHLTDDEQVKKCIDEFDVNVLLSELKSIGFRMMSDSLFKSQLRAVFNVDNIEQNDRISNHENYFIYLSFPTNDPKEALMMEYSEYQPSILFFKGFNFFTDVNTILAIVNNSPDKQELITRTFHRNMYVFHDSKASRTWLLHNDKEFLGTLVKVVGYDKDDAVNKFILEHTWKKFSTEPRNYSVLRELFSSKGINGKLQIREGLMRYIAESATEEDDQLVDMMDSYGNCLPEYEYKEYDYLRTGLSKSEMLKIMAHISYYGRLAHLKSGVRGYWSSASLLWNSLSVDNNELIKEIKKNNYYKLPDYEKMIEDLSVEVEIATEDYRRQHQ